MNNELQHFQAMYKRAKASGNPIAARIYADEVKRLKKAVKSASALKPIDWNKVEQDMRDSFMGRTNTLSDECARAFKEDRERYGELNRKVRGMEIERIRSGG